MSFCSHYAKCHCAECHKVVCHYVQCRSACERVPVFSRGVHDSCCGLQAQVLKLPDLQRGHVIALKTKIRKIVIGKLKQSVIVKNQFGLYLRYCIIASSYLNVVQTSTDSSQHFSAPSKAGKSRQAQTCYVPQNINTKKLHCSYQFTRVQEKQEFS